MKKYFLHLNGSSVGPYSFEDLRMMRIQPTTPVWYDGLGNWKNAGDVFELKSLFLANTQNYTQPHNFSKPPASRSSYNFTNDNLSGNTSSKKNGGAVAIIIGVAVLIFVGVGAFIYTMNQRKEKAREQAELMEQIEDSLRVAEEMTANQDAAVEQAPDVVVEAAPDYGTSTYSGRFNNYSGGIVKVQGTDENHLMITLKLRSSDGCSGEVSGEGSVISENKVQMRTSSGCRINIRYSNSFITVEESTGCSSDHGSGCSFEGIYSRE
jgi:hypothetical protein